MDDNPMKDSTIGPFRPINVAIEGVSLAGKSTLCRILSSSNETEHVPELSTFHDNGRDFPEFAESDQQARDSDDWFFNSEVKRHQFTIQRKSTTPLVVMDRSFLSMIVFGLARKLIFDVGEPWLNVHRVFNSELGSDAKIPIHMYLRITSDEYKMRRSVTRQQSDNFNDPDQRVRFDEQQASFIDMQIKIYDLLLYDSNDRIITGHESPKDLLSKANKLTLVTEGNEHEFLRKRIDSVLSEFGFPDTRH